MIKSVIRQVFVIVRDYEGIFVRIMGLVRNNHWLCPDSIRYIQDTNNIRAYNNVFKCENVAILCNTTLHE